MVDQGARRGFKLRPIALFSRTSYGDVGSRPLKVAMIFRRASVGRLMAAVLIAAGLMCGVAQAQLQDPSQNSAGSSDPRAPNYNVGADRNNSGASNGGGASDRIVSASPFQPTPLDQVVATPNLLEDLIKSRQTESGTGALLLKPVAPGEFEDYVARIIGRRLPRFGQDLVLPSQRDFAAPSTASVPPDYLLNVGDTVELSLTGSVTGTLELQIDTNGRIFIPNVGPVVIAGVRYADLKDRVTRAIGAQFKDYTVTVAVKSLRGIRVYVTGFANNPGAFTVSSLSTLMNAVFQAGGPSSGGSFRSVKLYRAGREVADYDLYKLLRGGDRIGDAVLQNEDVLFIPPAGAQLALIGSVQQEAIYEILPGETLERTLQLAGGANVLGDPDRVVVYNTRDPNTAGPRVISRKDAQTISAQGGDIIQILSRGSLQQPTARQSIIVRIEGEVSRPGNYYLAPNSPLSVALEAAGGLTDRAYPFGAKLQRQSVLEQQRVGYREAIRQLEFLVSSAPLATDASVSADLRATQSAGARAVLEQLRRSEPDGRVVMLIQPSATELPSSVLLENNDHIVVPPRPTAVGVFGAVYRQGSFLLDGTPLKVSDYIQLAGGTHRAADARNIFVVRANGEVLTRKNGGLKAQALPGDIVFVPVKTATTDIWARVRDTTTILYQIAIAVAAANSLK